MAGLAERTLTLREIVAGCRRYGTDAERPDLQGLFVWQGKPSELQLPEVNAIEYGRILPWSIDCRFYRLQLVAQFQMGGSSKSEKFQSVFPLTIGRRGKLKGRNTPQVPELPMGLKGRSYVSGAEQNG